MCKNNTFIVRLPAPPHQQPLFRQKTLAEIAYRWVATLNLLLAAIGTMLVLTGL